jgi:hypothetical protein
MFKEEAKLKSNIHTCTHYTATATLTTLKYREETGIRLSTSWERLLVAKRKIMTVGSMNGTIIIIARSLKQGRKIKIKHDIYYRYNSAVLFMENINLVNTIILL